MKVYDDKGVVIMHGDSRQLLQEVPSESIDLILTDPPYNVGLDYSGGNIFSMTKILEQSHRTVAGKKTQKLMPVSTPSNGNGKDVGEQVWNDKLSEVAYFKAMEEVIWECRRVLKKGRWLVFTMGPGQMFGWDSLLQRYNFERRWTGVWAKPHQMSGRSAVFSSGQFVPAWEAVLCYSRGPAQFMLGNGSARRPDVWIEDRPDNVEHPAARAIGLWEDLMSLFSEPGERVLDPFLGSGTTAVMAARLRRKCLGIEYNLTYAQLAAKRTAGVNKQARLEVK